MHSSDPNYHRETAEKSFDKYNVIVCVSPGVKTVMEEAFPKYADKMIVIENYVDADEIIVLSKQNTPIKKEKYPILATCGRLSREKGFDLAVEAASILKGKNIGFQWFFIGDGDERGNIEKMIDKYHLRDKITITGFTDNPYTYIKCCDVYIQPSYEESYGRTIKEALILGKQIVSTNTIGAQAVLQKGVYGLLVSITAQGIADGVAYALENNTLQQSYKLEDNINERIVFINSLEQMIEE